MDKVSIIIPCFNEQIFIGKCLDSIIASDWPKDNLEVLVVDGESQDDTVRIVEKYCGQFSYIRLMHNPKRLTPSALNIGIVASKGNIIMRMDAHASYTVDYISKCVSALKIYDADNVGGIIRTLPGDNTLVASSIALSLSHPFGVGSSHFRVAKTNVPYRSVDTVPFGCFRRELIERIGPFNERLPVWKGRCNEDMDFNKRILSSGGKIILVTSIVSFYYSRRKFLEFLRHNFNNGVLITLPLGNGQGSGSVRHFIPMLFMVSIVGLLFGALMDHLLLMVLLFILCTYFSFCFYFSFKTLLRQKRFFQFFFMPITFIGLHLSYGLGSVYGLFRSFTTTMFPKLGFINKGVK